MASSTNKSYNGIGNGNGNANQVDTRQISITDPKNNRTFSISIYDYKTKWEWYDLRISISAPKHLQDLANAIERDFYSRGRQQEIADSISKLDPNASIIWGSVDRLVKQYNELIEKKSEQREILKQMIKDDEDLGLYTDYTFM